jgi:hypothetical protein
MLCFKLVLSFPRSTIFIRQLSRQSARLHLAVLQDQAIQRLLGDIKELRSEGAASEGMHASGESDVNQVRPFRVWPF